MIILRNGLILLFFIILLLGCGSQNQKPHHVEDNDTPPTTNVQQPVGLNDRLLEATNNGDYQRVEKLLEEGADVNATNADGWITPLHIASFNGYTDIARILLQYGADINAEVRGWIPLEIAFARNHADLASFLNEASSSFFEAAKSGEEQLVKTLLKKGVSVNAEDAEGWTALHQVSVSGHTDIAKFLIQRGAIADAKDVDDWTPLMVASVNGYTDVVKLLIQNGADVNARDKDGMAPLHGAAVNGYNEVAILLIQSGANVNVGNKNGVTPLLMALSVNRTNMANLLIENGADVEVDNPGDVEGLVEDALTGKPLSDASIKVFHQNRLVKVKKTGTNGHYAFVISEGDYILEISLAGYIPAMVHVNVTHNEITTVTSVRQVSQAYSGKGIASGKLLNAFNGQAVNNATLKIRSGINVTTGAVVATTKTNSNGNYRISLAGGNYTIEATKKGHTTIYFPIVSVGKHTSGNQNASITPTINKGEIRIVLTWGIRPMDLDAHLLTPNIEGRRHHIFFNPRTRGQRSSAPYVQLDVDDTSSYGPETITIYKSQPGTYHYYVHNYSGTPAIRHSDAKVEIYSEIGQVKSYNIPISGKGKYWNIFSYEGSTGKITTIDKIFSVKPN